MADEAELRTTENHHSASLETTLDHVLDQLQDAVLLLDENWRIIYANHAAFRISHLKAENLNRETLWELYPETVGTDLDRAYREVRATRSERRVEAFYYAPFKTWFNLRILPTERGVAVHYRDVTAIRAAVKGR